MVYHVYVLSIASTCSIASSKIGLDTDNVLSASQPKFFGRTLTTLEKY